MEIPQQSHICRFFQNFSSVNQIHPGKFLRKQDFLLCVVLCKHRIVVEAGRERLTTGASSVLRYQLPLFHYKQMEPHRHPHSSSPPTKAAGGQRGFGRRGCCACRRCRAAPARERQMPDRGAAPVSHLSCAARRLGLLSPHRGCSALSLCDSDKN